MAAAWKFFVEQKKKPAAWKSFCGTEKTLAWKFLWSSSLDRGHEEEQSRTIEFLQQTLRLKNFGGVTFRVWCRVARRGDRNLVGEGRELMRERPSYQFKGCEYH